MERIALLGLGAMGSRMARRLVTAGYEVDGWSRSGVPPALADLGMRSASSPREAVARADVILSMVSDDAASRAVWSTPGVGALAGLRADALAIESSTLTPDRVSSLGAEVAAQGGRFLDAPVVGSRPQADAGALVYLVGGAPEDVARARSVLANLGSAIHHLGPTPAGTSAKLLVNALFGVQVALVGELLGLVRASGLDEAKLLEVVGGLPVTSPAAKLAMAAIGADRFDPMFPIALVAKDFRYVLATAASCGASLPLTRRSSELFDQAVSAGLGDENITAIAKLFR